jgi:predicted enzyme related to lactoylglutathione lyase
MQPIVWWEIESPDPEAFQRFHSALWSWEYESAFAESELGADYWIIKADGTGVGGLQRSADDRPPHAGVRLYLEVDDLEQTLQRVTELGGQVERRRVALGGSDRWFGVALDPSGVSFGLWTRNPPAAR